MPDRRNAPDPGPLGYPQIGYGRGYGRDFGGGGLNQGFDGSWGQGYGASLAPSDYREGFAGEAFGLGVNEGEYARSFGGRGDEFGGENRTWMERRAEQDRPLAGPHAGKGPGGWTRSDERLKEQVSEALMQDRLLDAREIEVQVEGGVVTLEGSVATRSDVHLAEMIVRRCGGVKEVRNTLSFQRPEGEPERPVPGVMTGSDSPLQEGEHDETGREEGPVHLPKLAT